MQVKAKNYHSCLCCIVLQCKEHNQKRSDHECEPVGLQLAQPHTYFAPVAHVLDRTDTGELLDPVLTGATVETRVPLAVVHVCKHKSNQTISFLEKHAQCQSDFSFGNLDVFPVQ